MAVVGGLASQPLITQGLNHAQTSELGRLSSGRGGLPHGHDIVDRRKGGPKEEIGMDVDPSNVDEFLKKQTPNLLKRLSAAT